MIMASIVATAVMKIAFNIPTAKDASPKTISKGTVISRIDLILLLVILRDTPIILRYNKRAPHLELGRCHVYDVSVLDCLKSVLETISNLLVLFVLGLLKATHYSNSTYASVFECIVHVPRDVRAASVYHNKLVVSKRAAV